MFQCNMGLNNGDILNKNYQILNSHPKPFSLINDITHQSANTKENAQTSKSNKELNYIINSTQIKPPSPSTILKYLDSAYKASSSPSHGMIIRDCNQTINSPNRKIINRRGNYEKQYSYDELTEYEEYKNDYTCGVRTTRLTNCKRNLNCKSHTYKEKLLVKRSKPLDVLLKEERLNAKEFTHRRKLAKALSKPNIINYKENTEHGSNLEDYPLSNVDSSDLTQIQQLNHNSKNRFTYPPKYYPTSASYDETDYELLKILKSNHNNYTLSTKEIFNILKSSFDSSVSQKKLYIHSLSRSSNIEEIIAYLHYKLRGFENVTVNSRVKEILINHQNHLNKIYNELDIPEILTPKQNL